MEERTDGQKQHLPEVQLQPTDQVILMKGRREGKEGIAVVAGAQQQKQCSRVNWNSIIAWQEREEKCIFKESWRQRSSTTLYLRYLQFSFHGSRCNFTWMSPSIDSSVQCCIKLMLSTQLCYCREQMSMQPCSCSGRWKSTISILKEYTCIMLNITSCNLYLHKLSLQKE